MNIDGKLPYSGVFHTDTHGNLYVDPTLLIGVVRGKSIVWIR